MAEKKCTQCNSIAQIPYAAHESEINRYEHIVKRQWVVIILLICMLFSCFATFVWYESQFETISYDYAQDGYGTNIIGARNEVNYGAEIESQSETQTQR